MKKEFCENLITLEILRATQINTMRKVCVQHMFSQYYSNINQMKTDKYQR